MESTAYDEIERRFPVAWTMKPSMRIKLIKAPLPREDGSPQPDFKPLVGKHGVILEVDGEVAIVQIAGREFWASKEMLEPAEYARTGNSGSPFRIPDPVDPLRETLEKFGKEIAGAQPMASEQNERGKFKVAFRGQLYEVTADQLVFEDGTLIDIKAPFRVENVTGALEEQLKAAPRPERGRKYLPTLSDLVDRMTIVQLKALFIKENREAYLGERNLIEHDIDIILDEVHERGECVTAADIHAIVAIMLTNHLIWINESKARAGGDDQDQLLKLTHSINGQRNAAKNKLARMDQGRRDFKLDCFAADLVEEYGHLQIF